VAADRNAPLLDADPDRLGPLRPGLAGEHQVANAAVAVRVLEVLHERGVRVSQGALASGLANVQWPGRLETRRLPDGREALLDAAHNRDGATALAAFLTSKSETKRPLVFGAMHDKDIDAMFRILIPAVSGLVITRASTPRAADPAVLAESARRVAGDGFPIETFQSPREAMEAAWRRAPHIVVAGSIFLLGDVMQAFGWA
jgi:dihydrofolate synthase/folylpolyglutamate synthase